MADKSILSSFSFTPLANVDERLRRVIIFFFYLAILLKPKTLLFGKKPTETLPKNGTLNRYLVIVNLSSILFILQMMFTKRINIDFFHYNHIFTLFIKDRITDNISNRLFVASRKKRLVPYQRTFIEFSEGKMTLYVKEQFFTYLSSTFRCFQSTYSKDEIEEKIRCEFALS